MDVQLRSAHAQDAHAISALIRSLSFHALVSPDGSGAEPFFAATSEVAEAGYIADPRYRFIVAASDSDFAGFIAVRDNSHVFHLFVAALFQRRGLATQLWQAARSEAIANGNTQGFTVNSTVFAVPLYERFGFVRTGPVSEHHGIYFVPMHLSPNRAVTEVLRSPNTVRRCASPFEPVPMPSAREVRAPVTFAAALSSDFETFVAIRIKAMRESLERIGRFDPVRARERFRSGFSPEHTRHVVVAGERVGFVVLKPQGEGLLLDHLYIKPNAQGQGVGSAVLAQVFAEADAQALPVRVGALRESAANRFYTRHGFRLVERGEFDNYYIRPCQNAQATCTMLSPQSGTD